MMPLKYMFFEILKKFVSSETEIEWFFKDKLLCLEYGNMFFARFPCGGIQVFAIINDTSHIVTEDFEKYVDRTIEWNKNMNKIALDMFRFELEFFYN